MARSSLDDFQGSIVDPAQTWNYDLMFERLPTGVSGSTSMLRIRCQAVTLPGVTFDPVDVEAHGIKLRFRGRRTYSNQFTATFIENVDYTTYSLFKQWHMLALSWTNNTGVSSAVYKVPCTITAYDDPGNTVFEETLYGVWPQEVADISYDGSGSDYVKPEVTFAFDYKDE